MSLLRKPITNLRIGTKGYCSDRVGKESILRDFWNCSIFDFCNSICQEATSHIRSKMKKPPTKAASN